MLVVEFKSGNSELQGKLLGLKLGASATVDWSKYKTYIGYQIAVYRRRYNRNYSYKKLTGMSYRITYEGPQLTFPPAKSNRYHELRAKRGKTDTELEELKQLIALRHGKR